MAVHQQTPEGSTGQVPTTRRTLVTGGAGFIGSHLVDLLLGRGDIVTVVDDLSTGRRENLPQTHERLRFIEADLGEALRAFGKGEVFDEIYHLAAAVGVKLVMDDQIGSIETNVEQTAALLRYAVTHGRDGDQHRPVPTLIASSSEVYGKSSKSPFCEDDDAVYGPTTIGRWSYACSKAIDEYLALAYHRQMGLPTVVTRFFNTVGPRQVGAYGMVLPRFVAAAIEGKPLDIYGDGMQSRCFCDVRDVAEVLPRLLAHADCHGRVFNIGSDKPISITGLADRVMEVVGCDAAKKLIPFEEAYGEGFEDLKQRQPDLSRVKSTVGFEPRISLDQTIRDVEAFIRHGHKEQA